MSMPTLEDILRDRIKELEDELKAYKDTRLTPEEIKDIISVLSENQDDVDDLGISVGLLNDLLELEKYRKTGLTPVEVMVHKIKEGDTVYYVPDINDTIRDHKIHEWKVVSLESLITWMEAGEIGKTLFLTREAAEEALKGGVVE